DHVCATRRNFSTYRTGTEFQGTARLPALRRTALWRRREHSGHSQALRKYSPIAHEPWAHELDQRIEIGAGPARVCHRHWPGEIRQLSTKEKVRRIARTQGHHHDLFQTELAMMLPSEEPIGTPASPAPAK